MGKWVHRLTNIDAETRKATCQHCGPVSVKPQRKDGVVVAWQCRTSIYQQRRRRGRTDAQRESERKRAARRRSEWRAENPQQLSLPFGPAKRKYVYVYRPRRPKGYQKHKGNVCARCGFTSDVRGQFDVHHVDHDHGNNDLANLLTLCANCHRLEHSVPVTR